MQVKYFVMAVLVVFLCYGFSVIYWMTDRVIQDVSNPSIGSKLAMAAATIIGMDIYELPLVQVTSLPSLSTVYKVVAVLVFANVIFRILFVPLIAFLGIIFHTLAVQLHYLPGCHSIMELNVVGNEVLEIVVAAYLLHLSLKATETVQSIMYTLAFQKDFVIQFKRGARREA